ncbi:hypothetical protein [Crossiella sp. NPDC003009]
MAKPVAGKPDKYAAPSTVDRAVKFSVTVVNGTEEPVRTGLLLGPTDAQFDGRDAKSVTDFNGPCGTGLDSRASCSWRSSRGSARTRPSSSGRPDSRQTPTGTPVQWLFQRRISCQHQVNRGGRAETHGRSLPWCTRSEPGAARPVGGDR